VKGVKRIGKICGQDEVGVCRTDVDWVVEEPGTAQTEEFARGSYATIALGGRRENILGSKKESGRSTVTSRGD